MNPAWSVVFFTVLAGFGQGLAVTLALAVLLGVLPPGSPSLLWGLGIAMAFLGGGLLSSFLHLGRPMRAWRAAAMWRTSWLSREVILLPAFIGLLALWALLAWRGTAPAAVAWWLPLGAIVLAFALWLCTAMIYACIRFIQEWAHPLTLLNYTLIGLASGGVLACALAAVRAEPRLLWVTGPVALAGTLAALLARLASFRRNAALKPRSTLQSATGVNARRLVQMSMGMSAGSFNTREFFHGLGHEAVHRARHVALLLGFVAPVLLMAWGLATSGALPWVAALVAQGLGLLAERWVFFAQARHPQNLYYQRVA